MIIQRSNTLRDSAVSAAQADLLRIFEDHPTRFWHALNAELHFSFQSTQLITGVPHPLFNGILRSRLTHKSAAAIIKAIIAQFTLRKLPFTWWVDKRANTQRLDELLHDQGLIPGEPQAIMVHDLNTPLAPLTKAHDLLLTLVDSPGAMLPWKELYCEGFGLAPHLAHQYATFLSRQGLGSAYLIRHYVALLAGKPAAVVSLFFDGPVIGIYHFTVDPKLRGQGIGQSLIRALFPLARNAQARWALVHVKDSSSALFRKMGFSRVCQYSTYFLY